MPDMIFLVYENDVEELLMKGKGNRDGLVQQIITYVKDGRTVTRKQWVRSEFADHAKKNEEEKKKTLLKEEEREEVKRRNELKEQQEKARHQDERAHKKKVKEKEELEEKIGVHKPHVSKQGISDYKKKMKRLRKQEEEERKKQDTKNKNHSKKEKKHSAFGQAESTRKQNKDDENTITKPNQ